MAETVPAPSTAPAIAPASWVPQSNHSSNGSPASAWQLRINLSAAASDDVGLNVSAARRAASRRLGSAANLSVDATAAPMQAALPAIAPPQPAPAKPTAVAAEPAADPQEFKGHGRFRPIQKGPVGGLTELQSNFLAGLIERYTKKTPLCKESTRESRPYLADPRACSGFERSGRKWSIRSLRTDPKARESGTSTATSTSTSSTDSARPCSATRLRTWSKRSRSNCTTASRSARRRRSPAKWPKLFCELTGNERVTFCNTGSEAVMAAMRVARTVTGRKQIVMFNGDYHGSSTKCWSRASQRRRAACRADGAGHSAEHVANMIVLRLRHARIARMDPRQCQRTRRGDRRAGAEPPSRLCSRSSSCARCATITEESGTALIFDEVVTGFRVHPGGAQADVRHRADMATYGKVVGGGMPIGILAGKRAVHGRARRRHVAVRRRFASLKSASTFFAGTFVRHPSRAGGRARRLEHLKEQGPALQQDARARRTAGLVKRLNDSHREIRRSDARGALHVAVLLWISVEHLTAACCITTCVSRECTFSRASPAS